MSKSKCVKNMITGGRIEVKRIPWRRCFQKSAPRAHAKLIVSKSAYKNDPRQFGVLWKFLNLLLTLLFVNPQFAHHSINPRSSVR